VQSTINALFVQYHSSDGLLHLNVSGGFAWFGHAVVGGRLQELDLQGCALHGEGAARVAEGVAASNSLCCLDISHCEVDAAGAPAISEMLATCTNLRSFFCRANPLSSTGARTIIHGYLDNRCEQPTRLACH
jgi:hypothetical protein